MADSDDQAVWDYAAARGLAVVSKDVDFHALAVTFRPPLQVIWLRVGNGPTRTIETLLRVNASIVRTFLGDPTQPLLELP